MKRAEILPPLVGTVLCMCAFFLAAMPRYLTPIDIVPAWTSVAFVEPPTEAEAADLQDAQQWLEAAGAWHQIANAEPDNGAAWFNLGYCLHMGGQYDDAIPVHRKAATFRQFRGIATYNLGCALALTGRHDDAIAALQEAEAAGFAVRQFAATDSDLDSLRSHPWFANQPAPQDSPGVLGKAMGMWRKTKNAVAQNAPKIAGEVVDMTKRTHRKVSNTVDGARHALAASRFAPLASRIPGLLPDDGAVAASSAPMESVRSIMARASQLQNEGRWLDAAATFDYAAQRDPENAMAWFGIAYSLHMGGAYEAAIPAHQKAATFDRVRGTSLYNLGCAYALLGRADDAIDALHAARDAGFDVAGSAGSDSDLDSLHDDPRFKAMLSR